MDPPRLRPMSLSDAQLAALAPPLQQHVDESFRDAGSMALPVLLGFDLDVADMLSSIRMLKDLARYFDALQTFENVDCGWAAALLQRAEDTIVDHARTITAHLASPTPLDTLPMRSGGRKRAADGVLGPPSAKRALPQVAAAGTLRALRTDIETFCASTGGSLEAMLAAEDAVRGRVEEADDETRRGGADTALPFLSSAIGSVTMLGLSRAVKFMTDAKTESGFPAHVQLQRFPELAPLMVPGITEDWSKYFGWVFRWVLGLSWDTWDRGLLTLVIGIVFATQFMYASGIAEFATIALNLMSITPSAQELQATAVGGFDSPTGQAFLKQLRDDLYKRIDGTMSPKLPKVALREAASTLKGDPSGFTDPAAIRQVVANIVQDPKNAKYSPVMAGTDINTLAQQSADQVAQASVDRAISADAIQKAFVDGALKDADSGREAIQKLLRENPKVQDDMSKKLVVDKYFGASRLVGWTAESMLYKTGISVVLGIGIMGHWDVVRKRYNRDAIANMARYYAWGLTDAKGEPKPAPDGSRTLLQRDMYEVFLCLARATEFAFYALQFRTGALPVVVRVSAAGEPSLHTLPRRGLTDANLRSLALHFAQCATQLVAEEDAVVRIFGRDPPPGEQLDSEALKVKLTTAHDDHVRKMKRIQDAAFEAVTSNYRLFVDNDAPYANTLDLCRTNSLARVLQFRSNFSGAPPQSPDQLPLTCRSGWLWAIECLLPAKRNDDDFETMMAHINTNLANGGGSGTRDPCPAPAPRRLERSPARTRPGPFGAQPVLARPESVVEKVMRMHLATRD